MTCPLCRRPDDHHTPRQLTDCREEAAAIIRRRQAEPEVPAKIDGRTLAGRRQKMERFGQPDRPRPKCKCGCGFEVQRAGAVYIPDHNPKKANGLSLRSLERKECECGCGETCKTPGSRWRPGHKDRGRSIVLWGQNRRVGLPPPDEEVEWTPSAS